MGGSGSKTKGYWPFAGSGSVDGDPTKEGVDEQSLARLRNLAHEFYEETVVTKNGRKRGTIKLEHPCIHVDFPVVLCEV
ncbi:unnamed protein product [Coregonus sp. 'balchen']|nr:unnamed protein product [Coregonus sp. 'balchen']